MTPANQTTFGSWRYPYKPGNCLSACVASILDMLIEEVPNFIDLDDTHEEQWSDRLAAWLESRGLRATHFAVDLTSPEELVEIAPQGCFYILCGLSIKRYEHAVVAAGASVVHDPHPSRTGLARATRMIVFDVLSG